MNFNSLLIEKNGTGIEKNGTGIEKGGTGIEKGGTGIEKGGTGIEKGGTDPAPSRSALSCIRRPGIRSLVFGAGFFRGQL